MTDIEESGNTVVNIMLHAVSSSVIGLAVDQWGGKLMANAKLNHHRIMQLRDEMNPVKPPLAITLPLTLCYHNMFFF